ncbi:MAG TPA: OPT/YSL family transporter, partial [bacterium]|nr:OPT/YSL family transporter [bacterium]
TILENNAIQSIATAAGYSNGALAASLAAYMTITNRLIPSWQAMIWLILLGVLGVLFAFPFKKRFINDEQQPFPEGKACGIVMEGLHSGQDREGVFKTKLMMFSMGLATVWKLCSSELVMKSLWSKLGYIPAYLDDFFYNTLNLKPSILDTQLKDLTVRLESDLVMYAFGGLIGIRIGSSLLLGALINYVILAPIMMKQGIIVGVGFKAITSWALWGGVAMMTTASLLSFFAKPKMLISAFSGMFSNKKRNRDVLKDIELPMKVFVIGIPTVGLTTAMVGHFFFHFSWWLGLIALPLVFIMTLISVHSTALTAITPSGPVGKITQLIYAVVSPGNITTNIMSACVAAETSSSASNLLMDIKPGYMLGAKPRQQALGHVLGVIVGVLVAVPVFYMMINYDLTNLFSEKLPAPAGTVWKAVAELLT